MLVLTRKSAESIQIGDDVVVKVIKTGKGTVKIGVEAPSDVRVMRAELSEAGAEPVDAAVKASPVANQVASPVAIPVDPETERAVAMLDQFSGVLSDQFPHVA